MNFQISVFVNAAHQIKYLQIIILVYILSSNKKKEIE